MRSSGEPCANLTPAMAHELLGDERRLAALVAIAEADRPLSVDTLATMLAARERGMTIDQVPPPIRGHLQAILEEEHLPLLRERDVVEKTDEGYGPGPNLPGLVAVADSAWEHLCPDA